MTENEIQDVLISGSSPRWVKITKGLLTGKATLYDLLIAELITQDEFMELEALYIANGINPENKLEIDTDWIVDVETGSMAEVDTQKEIENFDSWVNFNATLQVPLDREKISIHRATISKIKDPEQYILKQPQIPSGGMIGDKPMVGQMPTI